MGIIELIILIALLVVPVFYEPARAALLGVFAGFKGYKKYKATKDIKKSIEVVEDTLTMTDEEVMEKLEEAIEEVKED